jgi:hypothetical protein
MSQILTITELTVPVILNGDTALYKLTTDTYQRDRATATDILVYSNTQWLFGKSKREIRQEYQQRRNEATEDRDTTTTQRNAEITEFDKVITATT